MSFKMQQKEIKCFKFGSNKHTENNDNKIDQSTILYKDKQTHRSRVEWVYLLLLESGKRKRHTYT